MTLDSCPICAGPLDSDGLCPACVEGSFDGRSSLSADGTLAGPERPAMPVQDSAPARPPLARPAVPLAPDPGHGVPVELELATTPARGDELELDERALAAAMADSPGDGVFATVPVDRSRRRPRRRWPWVVVGSMVLLVAAATAAGAAGRIGATRFISELFDKLETSIGVAGDASGDRVLAPGIAGAVLLVDSEPAGAAVYAGGELLGTTPLAVDNPYPDGEQFELTVKKAGYVEARLAAEGGEPGHYTVRLRRGRAGDGR